MSMNTSGVPNWARMPAVASENARGPSSCAKASICSEITLRMAAASSLEISAAGDAVAAAKSSAAQRNERDIAAILAVYHRSGDHRDIQADPPQASEVDIPVAFAQPVPEPQQGREQVCAPGEQRHARSLMADPDDPDLRHGHQHGEYRHGTEHPAQPRFGRGFARDGRGGIGHGRLLWC